MLPFFYAGWYFIEACFRTKSEQTIHEPRRGSTVNRTFIVYKSNMYVTIDNGLRYKTELVKDLYTFHGILSLIH